MADRDGNVRDRLWLWCHEAGSHNGLFSVTEESHIEPVDAARSMGLENALVIRFGPTFDPEREAAALAGMRRVVWSIVGNAGHTEGDEVGRARDLATRRPNFTGVVMDDFFLNGLPAEHAAEGERDLAVHNAEALRSIRERLTVNGRTLDLWVVLYDHQLGMPLERHLAQCDVVTFWTWRAENLVHLEENLARAETMAAGKRLVLGCYMWDYGTGHPMPLDAMRHQVELGERWLREGRIEGMIFLASCICDLELEAVEWTRRWITGLPD